MEIIFSSSVIATVVAGLFSFISTRKQEKLKYITDERSVWRKEIRCCAERIRNAHGQELGSLLDSLRIRINAYGMFADKSVIKDDSHIWNLILEIEEQKYSIQEIDVKKTLLVNYLALLLKNDWERAKAEVNIGWHKAICMLSLVVSYVTFAFIIIRCGILENESMNVLCIISIILILILLASYCIVSGPISNKVLSYYSTQKESAWLFTLTKTIIVVIEFLYYGLCFAVVKESLSMFKNWNDIKVEILLSVFLFMVFSGIAIILNCINCWNNLDEKKRYYDCVSKCELEILLKEDKTNITDCKV